MSERKTLFLLGCLPLGAGLLCDLENVLKLAPLGAGLSCDLEMFFTWPLQVLADRPESADQYEFSVEDGDVILMATDGIFDNVPDRLLVQEMDKVGQEV